MRRRLRLFAAAWVIGCTAGSAVAAEVVRAVYPDLVGLPWLQALAAIAVTVVAGTGATLSRKIAALYEERRFHSRWEFGKDIIVSVAIGVAGYFFGQSQQVDPDLLTVYLVLAGFGGTRVLTTALDRALGYIPRPPIDGKNEASKPLS